MQFISTRPLFICEALETCKETSNCCAHKRPHIKDERCIPKVCRFGPEGKEIDCVKVDAEKKPETVTKAEIVAEVTKQVKEIPGIELAGPVTVKEPEKIEILDTPPKVSKKGGRKKV
jgi:hypothetical protein